MTAIESWEILEKLQDISSENICDNLKILIATYAQKLNKELSALKLMDIGCGSGNLSSKALKKLETIEQFNGVDIDERGLVILEKKGINSKKINLEYKDVLDATFDAEIYICLSNTFLALGNWNKLERILDRIFSSEEKKILLISIVPWDKQRVNWHNEYLDWVECHQENNKMQIRSMQIEDEEKIKQTLEIKYNGQVYSYKNDILKTTCENFSQFIENKKLKICNWLNPYTLEVIDQETYALPEVWIEIRNF